MEELSLPALFHRALSTVSKITNLSTLDDETQNLVGAARSDIRETVSRVSTLGLFSPNETLEDIASRDLVYLFAPFVAAEVEGRVRTTEPEERMERIRTAQTLLEHYAHQLVTYGIIPDAERDLYSSESSAAKDATRRRELKIKQYKKEKELRGQIETIRKRRNQSALPETDTPTDFTLIASLLPSQSADSDLDSDSDTEDALRDATLVLLRLTYTQTQAQLESLNQELQLLRNAPPRAAPSAPTDRDATWRLDAPSLTSRDGPLLDPSGKPLRPFTILPAGAADRARLQAQVFQPDHRLPTMSIDEYLEIERQRGNIITGGGPASEAEPTSSEQLALDAEMDGSAFGEQKTEEKRLKDEKWARYTDANPRGAGNTMNRG